jgi:phage baseplate assembly protein W
VSQQSGFTGISYPFRISNRGGCVTSTTSATDPTHIAESIQQIFITNFLERPMESDIYSDVSALLFEPNNETLQVLLKSDIVDAIERLEERVEVNDSDISFEVEVDDVGIETLYAYITYTIIKYNTEYTSKIKVGEINNE